MRTIVVTLAAAALVAAAPSGFAGQIQKRQTRQERRIDQGVESGKLTPREAERLNNQEEIIEKERDQAFEGGKLSRRERRDIRHDQRRASQDIRHKKQNAKRAR